MRRGDLARDPRFATAELRLQNFEALHAVVQTWILTFRDMEALDAQFDEAKIAVGQVRTLQDLAGTEWAAYWGAVHEVSDRHGGTYRLQGRPWRFSDDTLDAPGAPAFRGEHNVEVFTQLGFSRQEIQRSIDAGMLIEHQPSAPPVAAAASAPTQPAAVAAVAV
jgi:crotonobetainyl-CoA:carnitine CoA-transferase CaiB-like acyl-CoA transferase